MSRRTGRMAALVAAIATCALPAGGAQAASTANIATAFNEIDETQVFDFAWDVSRQRGDDPVLHENSAVAHASCFNCDATAIAFQIVLVAGSPDTVVPKNIAEALNFECTACAAVAEARQFVRVIPQRVRFTGAGRATLSDVQADLEALETQDLAPLDLHLAVEAQEARVRDVLNNELVLRSDPNTTADATSGRVLQDADEG